MDRIAGSIFAKLQTFVPAGEAFRPATTMTCQRNHPAQARHKNEARPVYTIPGIPMPCRPVPEQSPSSWPNAASSSPPPLQGLKDKAKAAIHQKAGDMKDRAGKVSSVILGNNGKNK